MWRLHMRCMAQIRLLLESRRVRRRSYARECVWVSFAEYRLFYRALLQKRPIISRSLLIVSYARAHSHTLTLSHTCEHTLNHSPTHMRTHTQSPSLSHTHTLAISPPHIYIGVWRRAVGELHTWSLSLSHTHNRYLSHTHIQQCVKACGGRISHVYAALQQTATDCNALQQTATHCNTLQHIATHSVWRRVAGESHMCMTQIYRVQR